MAIFENKEVECRHCKKHIGLEDELYGDDLCSACSVMCIECQNYFTEDELTFGRCKNCRDKFRYLDVKLQALTEDDEIYTNAFLNIQTGEIMPDNIDKIKQLAPTSYSIVFYSGGCTYMFSVIENTEFDYSVSKEDLNKIGLLI